MKVQLIRHATLLLELAGKSYLADPMFSEAEAWDPVSNSANPQRNPMVELPLDRSEMEDMLNGLSAVFVTHMHADHWDEPAKDQISKELPVYCQPNDPDTVREAGFTDVRPVQTRVDLKGMDIFLTGGRHGTGEVADRIGPVSGFVIRAQGEPSLYIAGDTIWCPEVELALTEHRPEVIVVNAGAAQFIDSDPITMDADDVIQVANAAPESRVVAVHMESINHCALTRSELASAIGEAGLSKRVLIPSDGETLSF